MANELAAVAGDIRKLDTQLAELAARRAHLLDVHKALEDVGRALGVRKLATALEPVRVHRAYGGRGYLVDWIKATLKAAAPAALDSITLARLAEEELGLVFNTDKERERFRGNSLTRALSKLADQGLAERAQPGSLSGNQPGRWRWKSAPQLHSADTAADGGV